MSANSLKCITQIASMLKVPTGKLAINTDLVWPVMLVLLIEACYFALLLVTHAHT